MIGGLAAGIVGAWDLGLPTAIHLPLALAAGFLGGALWGFIPGLLKARTGAHEVIVTIMLNYTSYQLVTWVLRQSWYQRPGRSDPVSPIVDPAAQIPLLIDGLRVNWAFPLALIAAVFVSWLLFRSTLGFEFRAVGFNPFAARYAGMNISKTLILTMALSGGLAGLGGATEILGVNKALTPGFSPGYGFDGLAIALLGGSSPMGVVLAASVFGVLRAGATPMQAATGIPIDLVVVIQALVIMFVAAPALIREIYRIQVRARPAPRSSRPGGDHERGDRDRAATGRSTAGPRLRDLLLRAGRPDGPAVRHRARARGGDPVRPQLGSARRSSCRTSSCRPGHDLPDGRGVRVLRRPAADAASVPRWALCWHRRDRVRVRLPDLGRVRQVDELVGILQTTVYRAVPITFGPLSGVLCERAA